ncbi:MAG: VWA domain-containing protein, partial [Pirellulaceae bacterium]|nr:VWA domain-containing protein [Pirellulaceae bacterium]
MSQFRFAQSEWVHLLWGALALAGFLAWLEFRGRAVLDRFVSRAMQARLVVRHSLLRRLSAVMCVMLAWILLVCALMRPQWGLTVQQSVRVDAQIMVCLDVSKSMLAEDVAPSRLERAKIELDALLGLLGEGEQVGLIAFAGKATVLCPLTTDFGFLRLVLADTEPSSVGLGGTQIGAAIRQALDGFRDAGDVNRLLLLLTDGEDHESYPVEAAQAAQEKGVKIVCIGFGDEAGSKIEVTDPRTGARSFVKDRHGQDVTSRLDGATLREIATITEGAYVPAGTGALDLESIYRAHIATLLRGRSDSQQQVVRQEAYQWAVLAALIALLLG